MKEKRNDMVTGFQRFLDYISGKAERKDRNAFERELQKDPFTEEALEGLSSLPLAEAENDMRILSYRLKRRIHGRRKIVVYRIAASVAVLMIISSVFIIIQRNDAFKETENEQVNAFTISRHDPLKRQVTEQQTAAEDIPAAKGTGKSKEVLSVTGDSEETEIPVLAYSGEKPGRNEDQPEKQSYPGERVSRNAVAMAPASVRSKKGLSKVAEGTVISSEDSMPLEGAVISTREGANKVVTGTEGEFAIDLPLLEEVTLIADFAGMKQKEFTAVADTHLKVIMEPSADALDEVVVVAYGAEGKSVDQNTPGYSPPEPAVGKSMYDKYIRENTRRPDSPDAGQRVAVVAGFIVRTDGAVDSIEILRSPDDSFSREAVRLIQQGPAWKPALRNGKAVNENVTLRIVFK